jgi:N-methylhydantoinase B
MIAVMPPCRLYRRGELNEEIRNLFLSNCRIPDQNWGDIKALMTGLNTAEVRMQRLLDSYGTDAVRNGIDAVLDYAEAQSRDAIRELQTAIEASAIFYHAIDSHQVLLRDVVAVEFGDDDSITIFAAGENPQN